MHAAPVAARLRVDCRLPPARPWLSLLRLPRATSGRANPAGRARMQVRTRIARCRLRRRPRIRPSLSTPYTRPLSPALYSLPSESSGGLVLLPIPLLRRQALERRQRSGFALLCPRHRPARIRRPLQRASGIERCALALLVIDLPRRQALERRQRSRIRPSLSTPYNRPLSPASYRCRRDRAAGARAPGDRPASAPGA